MRNVHFRIDPRLALNIRHLEGGMRPNEGHAVVDFNDPGAFTIEIVSAEVGMTSSNLHHLLNQYVFNYEGAPLTIHTIETTSDGLLRQIGTVHKIVDIPFEMTAEVSATPEGLIRLHPVSMEICGIPGLPLMKALGIQLDGLLDLSKAKGVTAEVNDLLLDPTLVLPPPAIDGKITEVRVEGDELVQVFGTGGSVDVPPPSDPDAPNYMFYWGGTLQFGRLFMVRSDLQLVDADPSDPFDFFLKEYDAQLVAGYSRTMSDGGLMAIFPDYEEIVGEPETVITPPAIH
jgi:hypothetical protein